MQERKGVGSKEKWYPTKNRTFVDECAQIQALPDQATRDEYL
mgnify:CR=1 FL=1